MTGNVNNVMMKKMTPQEFLWNIEHDPDSFTEGHRNDDVVNWVCAKILVAKEKDNLEKQEEGLENDWLSLVRGLTEEQKESLENWEVWPWEKIRDCWKRYSGINVCTEAVIIDQGGYRETYKKAGK